MRFALKTDETFSDLDYKRRVLRDVAVMIDNDIDYIVVDLCKFDETTESYEHSAYQAVICETAAQTSEHRVLFAETFEHKRDAVLYVAQQYLIDTHDNYVLYDLMQHL